MQNADKKKKPRAFLYISLGLDLILAAAKFIAAAFSGSSAMISEGIHSTIDAASQILLIWGVYTSKKQPDEKRPFGYGKELYFWSFIVSLIIFLLGGCISIYEGILRMRRPGVDGAGPWNYIILSLALVLTVISMTNASKAFKKQRGELPFWKAVIRTKDPTTPIVLLGDYGDLMGILIAFAGVYLTHRFNNPVFDGLSSIFIGLILAVISGLLIRESKSLLVGEVPTQNKLAEALQIAGADASVLKVKKHFSTVMAPDHLILIMNIVFRDDLTTTQIAETIERITKNIQKECPTIKQIFMEPVR
jgi:cation diffusion facilitator family transporter